MDTINSFNAGGIVDVIIRHPKEKLSKCSLTPLQGREDLAFYRARQGFVFDSTAYILLDIDAPVLSAEDKGSPLLLLDSTWRLLPRLMACLKGTPIRRSIPGNLVTAYPRKSKIENDPSAGLASVEALFAARHFLGRGDISLLEQYRWKADFMRLNKVFSEK